MARLKTKHAPPALAERLTAAETELLRLLANGYSTKIAASHLGISENTAANRRENLMRKLGVHEVTGLVRIAMKLGMVNL